MSSCLELLENDAEAVCYDKAYFPCFITVKKVYDNKVVGLNKKSSILNDDRGVHMWDNVDESKKV